ncbi:MAG: pallilysin-related adhesin [Treponema sp.]|jgi:hypothetical protein|nr:pallilysin-related adhesin [Treponema sp.]
MKKKKGYIVFSILVALICILIIISLATNFWERFTRQETVEQIRTRIVTPGEAGLFFDSEGARQASWTESPGTKIPLERGEIAVTVLAYESEDGLAEEQIVAYRNADEASGPVYITCIRYDDNYREYRRIWDSSTAASRAETTSLFTQDLIGDRNICIIVTGMNARNEHTMTVFKRNSAKQSGDAFSKILELQIDGSIVIQETARSIAYQQGITTGRSFNIAAYGHDSSSSNILDQLETIYAYNQQTGQYERSNVARIPGSQIEQRRLRELLSGESGVFEEFINDLWYYVSPQGTVDSRQYLYFNPSGKEIIFFGDETQQVFQWQNSTTTRYGLYIKSQNISISTLLRFIDIELESLDSIRLRVFEDVRLKITVNTSWDGSYRRAGAPNVREPKTSIRPASDAVYDSTWGKLQFNNSGEYIITSGGSIRKGRYVFFKLNNNDLLELRPSDDSESNNPENRAPSFPDSQERLVYQIDAFAGGLILSRVRLGTNGIQDLLEPPVTLTPVNSE